MTYKINVKYWTGNYSTIVKEFDSEQSFNLWLDVFNNTGKVIGWEEIDSENDRFKKLFAYVKRTKDIPMLKNILLEILDNGEWQTSYDTWKDEINNE